MTPERRRELARARVARYRARHPERIRAWKTSPAGRESEARYAANNRASIRAHNKAIQLRYRAEVLAFFGGICVQCGFDDHRAIQIDHVHGGGGVERRQVGSRNTTQHVRKLILTDPQKARAMYQLLCANCNVIKRMENGEHRKGVAA